MNRSSRTTPGTRVARGIHQHEPMHTSRMPQRELRRQPPAEGQSNHIDPVEPQGVEHVDRVEDQVLHRLDLFQPL